ncbi:glycosyltransferase family 39 protein, partial [Acinetobacter baumannii]
NVHLDVVEAVAWGHEWQWGYHKGPPMSAWAAEVGARLAPGQLWPIFLISQICVAVTFLAIWRLARRIMGPRDALISLLITTGI